MYRRIGSVIVMLIMIIAGSVGAQNLLNGVESVSFDSINNRYLASSLLEGTIVALDTSGNQTLFRDGLGSTFGNFLLDGVLYVTTPGRLYGLDAVTGETVFEKSVTTYGNLDGITADTSGFLYMMDTSGRLLKLRLSDKVYWVFASGFGSSVQDCTFDKINNRVIMVSYLAGTQIWAVSLNDSTTVVEVTTNAHGRYDGVNIDARGNFYVSTHAGGSVYRYNNNFDEPPELVSSGHMEPAGNCFNNRDWVLAVSEFAGDKVALVNLWEGPQINSLDFDDSSGGDGDGLLEDGETIQLTATLNNLHEETITGVSAELTVSGPTLDITTSSFVYGDIIVGGSADNASTPFVFDIPDGCGRQVANFSLTVTWTSNYGTKIQTLTFEKSTGKSTVLLIDDDGQENDIDFYYSEALVLEDSTYDVWKTSWGTPDASYMNQYDIVIWFTGDHQEDNLSTEEITSLKLYLDNGGNLLLSGQGIASELDTTDVDFLNHYLRCEYLRTNYYPYFDTDPGTQVFDSSPLIRVDGTNGANNQTVLDHIGAVNGSVAELKYWGQSDWSAVSYSGDYRLLFLSFGFEAIINDDDQWTERNVIFPQMMEYFEWINPLFCCDIRADLDFNGAGPDIADLVYLVDYMFAGGDAPPCWQASDIDANGAGPDIADLVYLVDYMFAGGLIPPSCL